LGGEPVQKFIDNVVVVGEVDVDKEGVFVAKVGRVDAGDAVVFYGYWGVGGGVDFEGEWASEVLFGRRAVE